MPIEIIRGNSAAYVIRPLLDGDLYLLNDGDRIIFTVKQTIRSDKKTFKRIITATDFNDAAEPENQGYKLEFMPEETRRFKAIIYAFDCVLELKNGERYTFIPPDDFIVRAVVNKGGARYA